MSTSQEPSLMEKVMDKLHLGSKDTTTHTTSTSAPSTSAPGYVGTNAASTPLSGSYDSRDLNRGGHVSVSEELKAGATGAHATGTHATGTHATGVHDSRDLNRDGHVSAGEKLQSGITGAGTTGANTGTTHDSRDLNQDGHTSVGEKIKSALTGSRATHDTRDLNQDGHVSTGEKIASAIGGKTGTEEARMKLHEEQLAVSKQDVSAGEAVIHKRVEKEHVQQSIPVKHEEVSVERRPLSGTPDPHAQIAPRDEVVRVPLCKEEVVAEKRVVPTEEVIVRKNEVTGQQNVSDTLRSEHVDQTQAGLTHGASTATGLHDVRDTNRDGHAVGEKTRTQWE